MSNVKVPLPPKVCDYWFKTPLKWEGEREGKCDYCPITLKKGDAYFEINVNEGEVKRGHLDHLEYAETIEWIPKEPPQ